MVKIEAVSTNVRLIFFSQPDYCVAEDTFDYVLDYSRKIAAHTYLDLSKLEIGCVVVVRNPTEALDPDINQIDRIAGMVAGAIESTSA